MALVPNLRTILSGVAYNLFADGAVEYRTLTSAPNASPRVYSAWATITGARCVEANESQVQDPHSGVWFREETVIVRIPYQCNVALTVRDQVRQGSTTGASANNLVWSVKEQKASAAGSVSSYLLYRRTPMMTNPREGGV